MKWGLVAKPALGQVLREVKTLQAASKRLQDESKGLKDKIAELTQQLKEAQDKVAKASAALTDKAGDAP